MTSDRATLKTPSEVVLIAAPNSISANPEPTVRSPTCG